MKWLACEYTKPKQINRNGKHTGGLHPIHKPNHQTTFRRQFHSNNASNVTPCKTGAAAKRGDGGALPTDARPIASGCASTAAIARRRRATSALADATASSRSSARSESTRFSDSACPSFTSAVGREVPKTTVNERGGGGGGGGGKKKKKKRSQRCNSQVPYLIRGPQLGNWAKEEARDVGSVRGRPALCVVGDWVVEAGEYVGGFFIVDQRQACGAVVPVNVTGCRGCKGGRRVGDSVIVSDIQRAHVVETCPAGVGIGAGLDHGVVGAVLTVIEMQRVAASHSPHKCFHIGKTRFEFGRQVPAAVHSLSEKRR